MEQRWFTPQSARRALDMVRPAAERIRRLYRGLEALRPAAIGSDQPVDADYYAMVVSLHAVLRELSREGVQLKDPRAGLVDFPARRAGRPVWLCWKVGEPSLAYWHELDDGFAGRQPLDEDGPWEDPGETPQPAG